VSTLLKTLLIANGYMAEAGADGAGSGAVDRGDFISESVSEVPEAPEDSEPFGQVEDPAEPEEPQEPEELDELEPKNAKGKEDKGRFIPKDRFDEAVRKERGEKEEFARRLKEYEDREAQRETSADYAKAQKAIRGMIEQHTSLLADGELEKASDLMEQILGMQAEMAEHKAEAKASAAKNQAKEEVRYEALVAKLEADYPQINPDAEEFDKATVRKMTAMMSGLMQTERMSASQALKEAVEIILGPIQKNSAGKERVAESGLRRKEEAVKKALEAKNKQPASTNAMGVDHDKTGGPLDSSAVMKMSYDEFVKLPESKLSELRGDFV
jgi:hypothetical protein